MKRLYAKPALTFVGAVTCENLCSSPWSGLEGFESFSSADGITSYLYESAVR